MAATYEAALQETHRAKSRAAVDAMPGEARTLLRVLTCGSVDDGKSTLIGRLLYDCGAVPADQLSALERDSKKFGTAGAALDFALLVDGLEAEREQGITIDVAYRYFSTAKRSFILADAPGHQQYTRNMATGASASDVAVILVDARKGVLTQTRRHSCIAHLLGIRHLVLAVNKIDLVGWSEETFRDIVWDYTGFAERLGIESVTAIPLSARLGDNILDRSARTPWYGGPTLLEHLERVDIGGHRRGEPFRFPVQWVNRPDQDFRGFSGTVAGGRVTVGDAVAVLPAGTLTSVARITTYDGDLVSAGPGDAVTLVLGDDVDASRGDVLSAAADRPEVADQIGAHLVWLSDEHMLPGRPYVLKCGSRTAIASISLLKHKLNVDTLEETAARTLELNEVGLCNLSLDRPLAFDPYVANRTTGGFILVDKISNETVAAGLIRHALRRATNIHWQAIDVTRTARATLKGQKPCCLWLTGLSGSGKSTLANALEKKLHALGRHTFILDGDNVRHGLCRDLGFTDADRVENIRRAGHVARLMADAGLIVIVSFISPYRAERRMARELFANGEFVEVYVDTPVEICESRDVKGLYAKARAGQLENFTGVTAPYEVPEHPDLHLDAASERPEGLVERIVAHLSRTGMLEPDTR